MGEDVRDSQSELVKLRIESRLHHTELEHVAAREANLQARIEGLQAQLTVQHGACLPARAVSWVIACVQEALRSNLRAQAATVDAAALERRMNVAENLVRHNGDCLRLPETGCDLW